MLEGLAIILMGSIFCFVFLLIFHSDYWKPYFNKEYLIDLYREYSRLFIFIAIALVLSSVRAIVVDRPIVVSDGYDQYAVILANWFRDVGYDIDSSLGGYQLFFP
jgi:hypothetical protein